MATCTERFAQACAILFTIVFHGMMTVVISFGLVALAGNVYAATTDFQGNVYGGVWLLCSTTLIIVTIALVHIEHPKIPRWIYMFVPIWAVLQLSSGFVFAFGYDWYDHLLMIALIMNMVVDFVVLSKSICMACNHGCCHEYCEYETIAEPASIEIVTQ